MSLRQAAEMALEALENCRKENEEHLRSHGITIYTGEYHATSAINKLREALARPDQLEDCKKILIERTNSLTKANYRLEQLNKQKPVAWKGVTGDYGFNFLGFHKQPGMEPLYLHPAPIPEGWQLVPEEPTLEMQLAAWRANAVLERGMVDVYKAMLAAAPKYEEQLK